MRQKPNYVLPVLKMSAVLRMDGASNLTSPTHVPSHIKGSLWDWTNDCDAEETKIHACLLDVKHSPNSPTKVPYYFLSSPKAPPNTTYPQQSKADYSNPKFTSAR